MAVTSRFRLGNVTTLVVGKKSFLWDFEKKTLLSKRVQQLFTEKHFSVLYLQLVLINTIYIIYDICEVVQTFRTSILAGGFRTWMHLRT